MSSEPPFQFVVDNWYTPVNDSGEQYKVTRATGTQVEIWGPYGAPSPATINMPAGLARHELKPSSGPPVLPDPTEFWPKGVPEPIMSPYRTVLYDDLLEKHDILDKMVTDLKAEVERLKRQVSIYDNALIAKLALLAEKDEANRVLQVDLQTLQTRYEMLQAELYHVRIKKEG